MAKETDMHVYYQVLILNFACFGVFHNFRLEDLKGNLAESSAVDMAVDMLDQDR